MTPLSRRPRSSVSDPAGPISHASPGAVLAGAACLVVGGIALAPLSSPIIAFLGLIACLSACVAIRSVLTRMVYLAWLLFFAVGTGTFYVAVAMKAGRFGIATVDLYGYSTIFVSFVLSAQMGSIFYESVAPNGAAARIPPITTPRIPIIVAFALAPIVYIASYLVFGGEIPIFSGRSLIDEMYSIQRTPLQAYGIVVALSAVACALSAQYSVGVWRRWMWAFVVIALFAGFLDGKRLFMLLGMFGVGTVLYMGNSSGRKSITMIGLAVAAIILYGVIETVRASGGFSSISFGALTGSLGVEHRDAAYAYTYFKPAQVQSAGYNWPGSTFASLVNKSLLEVVGISKAELSQHDSARVFMRLLGVRFGIRIGIIAEFWFAFSYLGTAAMFVFGLGVSALSHLTARTSSLVSRATCLTILANMSLAVVSQSTVIFGLIPTILYLLAMFAAIDFLGSHLVVTAKPRRLVSDRWR